MFWIFFDFSWNFTFSFKNATWNQLWWSVERSMIVFDDHNNLGNRILRIWAGVARQVRFKHPTKPAQALHKTYSTLDFLVSFSGDQAFAWPPEGSAAWRCTSFHLFQPAPSFWSSFFGAVAFARLNSTPYKSVSDVVCEPEKKAKRHIWDALRFSPSLVPSPPPRCQWIGGRHCLRHLLRPPPSLTKHQAP